MNRAVLMFVLAFPLGSMAQEACGPVPTGQGGDWFRAYQKWCKACGGTPSENASPATCKPGPTWQGGAAGSAAGSSSLIEQSIQYGAKSGDVGGALLGVGVGILVDDLFAPTDPQAEQRRIEAQRQRALAEEREREAQKDRIVSQLKGSEVFVRSLTEAGSVNALGLKLGDRAEQPTVPGSTSECEWGTSNANVVDLRCLGSGAGQPGMVASTEPGRAAPVPVSRDALQALLSQWDADPQKKQDLSSFIHKVTPGYLDALGWSRADRDSVLALNKGSGHETELDLSTVRQIYGSSMSRSAVEYAELAAAARQGKGQDLIAEGFQSTNDCAVFALANAANLPYSVAAARANDLVSTAPWRTPAERRNPASVFRSGGLNGVEVNILAQGLGSARVVERDKLADELAAGRAVVISIDVPDKDDRKASHQVVVTRSFQHKGEMYYEVMDSNAKSARCPSCKRSRTYWEATDFLNVANTDGIVLAPKAGSVVRSLR